jgi:nitroimidazol reductase NimA-like FMN-containing flavoprotein (pyridoxamine 5'-phosphate oxidase superfamily)
MDDDEIWDFLTEAHTGILTTLKRDGTPVALPVWFAVVDRRIYTGTRGKKLLRIAHDARSSFLVESGLAWAELKAVHVATEARILEDPDPDLAARIAAEMARNYRTARTPTSQMQSASADHYKSNPGRTVELVPTGKILAWDNSKMF